MRYLTIVLLGFLLGCVPEVNEALKLHEIALFSNGLDLNKRHAYFYGEAQEVLVSGSRLGLSEGRSDDPFAVESALLVDGKPYLSQSLGKLSPPPTRVQRIPLTTEVQLEVGSEVKDVLYFDGLRWFTLVGEAKPGFKTTLVPKERLNGLVGVGNLSREEAEMLRAILEPRGALAVTVMPDAPVAARQVDGFAEYLQTALYIQLTLPTDITAYNPPARDLIWEILAEGNQAIGFSQSDYIFITDESQLLSVWNKAYGAQLSVPALPQIDFTRETLVAIFMGEKPTGGFGIQIDDISLDQGAVYINMQLLEPAPGMMMTQALTSPWMMVRILRGGVNAAWFRNPASGELFAVARR